MWIEKDNVIKGYNTCLSMDQIIDIIKHYTNPWVKKQKVKYVYPFHFNYQKFKMISRFFSSKYESEDESDKHAKFKRSFLPLFNDYFFNNVTLPKSQIHSKRFKISRNSQILFDNKNITIGTEKNHPENASARNFKVDLRLFQYGVGFLVLTNAYSPDEEVPYQYILQMDELMSKNVSTIFHYYVGDYQELNIDSTRRGIVYESIEISQDSYVLERKQNIVLMACSANKRTYIADEKELKQELNEKYLSRGDYVFYGFSRSCGVQFVVDHAVINTSGLNRLTENFLEEKFYIFLFAIQQRDAIRQFSDLLVRSSLLKQKLKASRIRKDFIEFITQVKLSHISDNNVIARFYDRWRSIFDSDSIYKEVSEKLDAIDGFQQSRLSHQFNFLSFIVFPVIAISSFFTMGIFKTDPIHVDLPYVVFISVGLLSLFFFVSNKK